MFRPKSKFGALALGMLLVGGSLSGADTALAGKTATSSTGSTSSSAAALATVELTWTQSQLGLLSNQVMSLDPGDVPAPPRVDNTVGSFNLASGGTPGGSGRRDFWLHSQTGGWSDTRVFVEGIDPLFFGDHPTLGGVRPQGGVVLRLQNSHGKNRGITLNNNIFGGIGILNVGVWEANPDGTGFRNRQTNMGFNHPGFPYGFEAILRGNVIRVRVFPMGGTPPPWDEAHPWVRTINLDTDAPDAAGAAAIPTPHGQGTNGVIAAHEGADPLAAVRLHTIRYEQLR